MVLKSFSVFETSFLNPLKWPMLKRPLAALNPRSAAKTNPAVRTARVHATLVKKNVRIPAIRKLVAAKLEKIANVRRANVHASSCLPVACIFHCSLHLMGPWYCQQVPDNILIEDD